MNREVYNIVLIHTARVWERIRLTQPNQEMPFDNIGSTDEIEAIATTIYNNDILQEFVKYRCCTAFGFWVDNTDEGMSDAYIENQAEYIINDEYLDNE